jgi:hypothetical protein
MLRVAVGVNGILAATNKHSAVTLDEHSCSWASKLKKL